MNTAMADQINMKQANWLALSGSLNTNRPRKKAIVGEKELHHAQRGIVHPRAA